jgi:ABC-type lipoprotein release transport system permease subunit
MNNQAFLNFLFLQLFRHKSKHIAVFILSTMLIFLLSAVLFISTSIEQTTLKTLNGESDFILQKIRAGNPVQTPLSWQDEIASIRGVSAIGSRIYGRYYIEDAQKYFTIIGVDFFDEAVAQNLLKTINKLDIKAFLEKDQMIIGSGVKSYLQSHYYQEDYTFLTPKGKEVKLPIFTNFPQQTALLTSDTILMSADNAREILGIDDTYASDIILNVANDAERDNVEFILKSLHYDAKVTSKSSIKSAYQKFFHYKSGLFLLLFILTLFTFMLILYHRYAMINSSDKKEIAILRMLGWSIKDVLKLKLFETLFIALSAYMLGIILAYIYVFIADAPLLRDIFLGYGNLTNQVTFQPAVDGGLFLSLFLLFILPFIFAVLFPVWRIAITEAYEGMQS